MTGLGIVGIAIGFGAQSLVKDYFNGALILIENQYGKGDVVRIAGVEGTVEDLTLRRTTLRDFDGNVHTVPNSAIVVASNLTRGWARIADEVRPVVGRPDRSGDRVPSIASGGRWPDDQAWHHRLLEAAARRTRRCPAGPGPRCESAAGSRPLTAGRRSRSCAPGSSWRSGPPELR